VRSLDKAGIEILSVKEMDSVGKDDLATIRAEVARKEGRGVYEIAAKLNLGPLIDVIQRNSTCGVFSR
jgi:hypothetical protein